MSNDGKKSLVQLFKDHTGDRTSLVEIVKDDLDVTVQINKQKEEYGGKIDDTNLGEN